MKSIHLKNRWTRFALCFIAGSLWVVASGVLPVAYGNAPLAETYFGDTGNKTYELLKVLILTIVLVTGAGGFGAYLATRKSRK